MRLVFASLFWLGTSLRDNHLDTSSRLSLFVGTPSRLGGMDLQGRSRHSPVAPFRVREAPEISSPILMASPSPDEESEPVPRWSFRRALRTLIWFNGPDPLKRVRKWWKGAPAELPETNNEKAPEDLQDGFVLVVGATGGVGRRIVEKLLKQGFNVRALARNRSKALAMLSGGEEPSGTRGEDGSGLLDIRQADITKMEELTPDVFEGVKAVFVCSAAIVTPKDDSKDRKKYYQGIKFFEPTVVDLPKDVDCMGVRNVVKAAKNYGSVGEVKLFGGNPSLASDWKRWKELDDVVMGGRSESKLDRTKTDPKTGLTYADFSGVVRDKFGGFVSFRTENLSPPLDLSAYQGLRLRVRGDGNRYKVVMREEKNWDSTSLVATVDTTPRGEGDEWETLDLPLSSFRRCKRAETTKDEKERPPTFKEIHSIQLMLSRFEFDGKMNPNYKEGNFSLQVKDISVYKENQGPRVVQISSAGVTRPGRSGLNVMQEPPAIRLNESLGYILFWKLRGEDAVRESDLPFTVIRPCALVEEAGGAPLEIGQGDYIKGKVSRDAVADLAIEALFRPKLEGTTFEVKCALPFSEVYSPPAGGARSPDYDSLLGGLKMGVTGKHMLIPRPEDAE
uniref:NADH:ubiquinone oxidoreductase intermediate-associated protein 30 domain-containing protein n=1 Tax=Chromera velia CCMP2878 TaxID=1169474 RepID=A0A0G4GLY8_9ALVE|mmetsp:Transcript_41239/g.81328  ORF Transcript_41239/g.81328 Transcript_41239/m.81328 type:complete len:619 (-) Transcript_41239:557-2413(-)|eukprot:Cvel_4887.t1-p1 / transcript=Cvel_4887.t1 / gene=Cvel_4887 / organism=Chromera_velia_CCMP2878 / gene_product=hypothetical protein / transcript_product=hypothetical protein / location=Cvel_scaffold220:59906-67935(-) / protein_length=618 / sequence_SO=supercontig / SO=protein_coding / is_pseudo=false